MWHNYLYLLRSVDVTKMGFQNLQHIIRWIQRVPPRMIFRRVPPSNQPHGWLENPHRWMKVSSSQPCSSWLLTYPSEKYESAGMIIFNLWENKSHVPVTTNQCLIRVCQEDFTGRTTGFSVTDFTRKLCVGSCVSPRFCQKQSALVQPRKK